jgi:hypothetical protein
MFIRLTALQVRVLEELITWRRGRWKYEHIAARLGIESPMRIKHTLDNARRAARLKNEAELITWYRRTRTHVNAKSK